MYIAYIEMSLMKPMLVRETASEEKMWLTGLAVEEMRKKQQGMEWRIVAMYPSCIRRIMWQQWSKKRTRVPIRTLNRK